MEADFIRRLSPEAKHYRFLGGIREVPPAELQRLCAVDGHESMAFVATISRDGRETEIGVSRYAPTSNASVREIAVTVADEWQHKGLGTVLMKHLTDHARSHGVTRLYSIDLCDNAPMRALAKDLHMTERGDPNDPHQTIYSLSL